MLRAQVARESGGESTSYLGMHRLAKLPQPNRAAGDLLYDSTAYINHLETNLERITVACEQALDLGEESRALREAVEEVSTRVNAFGANRNDLESRLSAVEALGDRLTALEVELAQQDEHRQRERERQEERQKQQQTLESNAALLERLTALERVVVEFQMREGEAKDQQQSELARLTARLEASEAFNAELELRCQGLEAAQKEGLARLRKEVENDKEKFQHEISMGQHRTLSTCTKQGILAQEELSKLQQQVAGLQREQLRQEEATFRGGGGGGGGTASLWEYLKESGEDKSTTMMGGKWEKKLVVLTAAFRHAEEGQRKSREEQQAAITRLQQSLAVVGEKALETATRQAEAVLGVVRQLEERLAGLEAKQQQQQQQQVQEGGPVGEEMWVTAAMGMTSTACFHGVIEERGEEEAEEEEEEEEEEAVTTALWQHTQEQQRLQEEEREIEEELMRATTAVLAAGAMMGVGGGRKEKKEEGAAGGKVDGEGAKRGHRTHARPRARAPLSAASHLQAPPVEPTAARAEQKDVLRQQQRKSGSGGLRGDNTPKVLARKKSLTPHPPPGPPPPSPPTSSSSFSVPPRRPQPRKEVGVASAENKEREQFLSWLSQQGHAKAGTGAAAAASAAGGAKGGEGAVRRRRSLHEQQQQQQQQQQMEDIARNPDRKKVPSLLKRGYHNVIV